MKIRKSYRVTTIGLIGKDERFDIVVSEESKGGYTPTLYVNIGSKIKLPLDKWKELVGVVEELEKASREDK